MVNKKGVGGRPQHNFWIEGKFLPVIEKNKPAALCKLCSRIIHNTAKKRLLQHRKNCKKAKDSSPADPPSDTDSDENEEGSEYEPSPSSSTSIRKESENFIQIEVEDEFDHNYSKYSHPIQPIDCAEVAVTTTRSHAKKRKSGDLLSFLDPGPSTSTSSHGHDDSSCSLTDSSDLLTVPKKKLHEMNIHSFIDLLSPEDKKNIDIALAKCIFGCNIPFSTVESDHFKRLISILRPAYKLPTRKTIAATLLDQVYEEVTKTDAEKFGEESVLLVDGWKNSTANTKNVVTMIHNNYGHVAFLGSFDFSEQSETGEELSKIVMKSTEIAREKYSTEIYAVVSDNASNMLKMGRIINESNLLHSGCNSHMGNLLAKEIVDEDVASKVTSLQKEFKNPHFEKKLKKRVVLPADTRWCSYRDSYENFLCNLITMRQILIDEDVVFKSRLKHLLFDDQFIEMVKIQKKALDPICNLVNKCQQRDCSLADAVELWLTLIVPEEHKGKLEKRQGKVFTKHALAANYLHPTYRGHSLNGDQIQTVEYYLYENLNGHGIESLNQFKSCVGIFGVLSKKENLAPMTFWESLQNHCKDLANFAVKLLKIPASSAQLERVFSNWSYVHSQLRNRLTGDRSKKLVSVYYSLKTKDTNKSDEY